MLSGRESHEFSTDPFPAKLLQRQMLDECHSKQIAFRAHNDKMSWLVHNLVVTANEIFIR